ncbi:MAG: class I SAM-dependent methyltransferase [Gemmatimonadetes bacterium]|nr:class I SAM-dependent methyltransferase [Gemmatimonadota bacterium]
MTGPLSSTIDRCRVCASRRIETILNLGNQPLANSLRSSLDEELQRFPLIICRCGECGTVQLTETVAPEVLFKHYVWVTGTSEGARRYAAVFASRIVARVRPGRLRVVEVASNDGTFLKPFLARGDQVLGVDPAQNIAAMAEADGVTTRAEFFGLAVARDIVARQGEADVVFARNVIPHVANANDVVAGMAHCLQADGTGAIEFHRADIILRELHYDSIYHEHLYFHSLHSIGRMLARHGLRPFDVATSPISGGSYVVFFSKKEREQSAEFRSAMREEDVLGVGDAAPWLEFARRCERHRIQLRAMVAAQREAGKRIIGYGASARSATMLNYCGIDHTLLDAVADRSELKHDLYTPGTDILIVPPERAFAIKPDSVLLLAWNFREEILTQVRDEHSWTGEVIVPLPGDPQLLTFA